MKPVQHETIVRIIGPCRMYTHIVFRQDAKALFRLYCKCPISCTVLSCTVPSVLYHALYQVSYIMHCTKCPISCTVPSVLYHALYQVSYIMHCTKCPISCTVPSVLYHALYQVSYIMHCTKCSIMHCTKTTFSSFYFLSHFVGVLVGVAIVATLSVVLLLVLAKVAGAKCKRRISSFSEIHLTLIFKCGLFVGNGPYLRFTNPNTDDQFRTNI